MEKYEKVLKLMQSKPDGIVRLDDKDLKKLLGDRLASYRIPMYMSNIRKKTHLDVTGIREGRKVVAYQLAAVAAPTESATIPPAVEIPTPAQPAEDLGIAQPLVLSVPYSHEPEPSDDGWSI
jgi:hypothetical protein